MNFVVTSKEAQQNSSLKTKQSRNVNVNSLVFFEKTIYELNQLLYGEFDPGSGRTLAACLIH
ncbi:hypothetical protein, partial [Cytobacillus oceanisediminis]|uniref:hypothetical protein n=1 Tax=Cytobacillus oceanisediminis TaxID=665099 RepID=UPI003735C6C2